MYAHCIPVDSPATNGNTIIIQYISPIYRQREVQVHFEWISAARAIT
jgi:hypothetical protein